MYRYLYITGDIDMYHVHYLCSATSAVLLSPHRCCRSFPGDLRIRPRHHIEEVQQSLGCISQSAYHSDLRSCRAVVLLVPRRRMSLLSAHSFRDIFRSAASAFAPPNLPRAWNQAHSPSSPIPGVKEESESALSAFSTERTPLVLHSAASRRIIVAMSSSSPYDDTKSLSTSEKKDDHHVEVSVAQVDTAAALVAGSEHPLDPAEAARIRKKIDVHILPLMMVLYWVQFMDKTTLGSSAILGIREDAHLSTSQYNWLGTIFYLSYLVFEFPQNLCLQRFPVGKWMSINIFVWAIAICCHAACTNFAGLFVVRILLGMCEGSITAGFMIVTSMFYTREEQTLRVGYWFLMNGTAQIISGFIAFGSLHIQTHGFAPWQWLMIITGIITLITAVSFWFLFPDSPTTAWFLNPQERANAVLRIKDNQTGVENKHFKKEQLIEALTDPKTWLFALLAAMNNIPNSLTNQRSIIVASFGFTTLQTTLLGCVDGLVEIVTIWTGVTIAAKIPNSRAYVGSIYLIPNILGVFLINFLPWSNKVGLLFSVWITGVGTTGFVLALGWIGAVTAGHTKKVTTNAMVLSAYCIGNAAGPFMWEERYKPRNHIPWIIIGICYACCIVIMLSIRLLLSRENKRRDLEPRDTTYDDIYIERVIDGKVMQVKVEKEFLDLTDKQNREYRYVL